MRDLCSKIGKLLDKTMNFRVLTRKKNVLYDGHYGV